MAGKEMTRRDFIRLSTATVGLTLTALNTSCQVGETRFDAKALGAKGDGTTDDTAAIQAIIDRAPADSVIHFPAGKYPVNNFQFTRSGPLTFQGEGDASVIIRAPVAPDSRIATFDNSNVTLIKLAFDQNGLGRFGGVVFYSMQKARIENTRIFDSKAAGFSLQDGDRYAYVFGRGGVQSQNVEIINNRIEDLQVEVDHAKNVKILNNTSHRSPTTAAFGAWPVRADGRIEDYLVEGNTIVDPFQYGIGFMLDDASQSNSAFRRITVRNNKINWDKAGRAASIIFGAGYAIVPYQGIVFEDLTVDGNTVEYKPTANPIDSESAVIQFQNTDKTGFNFVRVKIEGNRIEGNRKLRPWAMDLRRLHDASVRKNTILGTDHGIAVIDDPLRVVIDENLVEATQVAYYIAYSNPAGGNRVVNNQYKGTPAKPLLTENTVESDVIEAPKAAA